MSTVRIKKTKNYFVASNQPFNDQRLSWEARGMMGYLLSKPDDWQVSFKNLVNESNAGRDKVRRILKELEGAGYLTRERLQKANGKFVWVSTVYETPAMNGKPDNLAETTDVKTTDGKPTDIISTDKQNTDTSEANASEKQRDPNLDNPAVKAFRRITRYHVPVIWRDRVVAIVQDLDLWEEVLFDWIGHGWNPGNVKGMIEVYEAGGIRERRNGKMIQTPEERLAELKTKHGSTP